MNYDEVYEQAIISAREAVATLNAVEGLAPSPQANWSLTRDDGAGACPSNALAEAAADADVESADRTANEALADEFVGDCEPGSVTEKTYRMVVDEIAHARNYLRYEECYRVELSRRYRQYDRINWIEAASEEDAAAGFEYDPARRREGVRMVGVRRATEDDLEEFVTDAVDEILESQEAS